MDLKILNAWIVLKKSIILGSELLEDNYSSMLEGLHG